MNNDFSHKEISEEEAGLRLDRWFKRHMPTVPHGHLEKLLRTGRIALSGKRARAGDRLKAGDVVRLPPIEERETRAKRAAPPPSRKEAAEMRRHILYQNEDLLVINKPAGLAVQGGTRVSRHLDGFLDALRFDAPERPKLTHRLDKDASGVMVLAKSARAAAHIAELFRKRRVQKIYWALTCPPPRPPMGVIRERIPSEGGEGKAQGEEGWKSAETRYALLQSAGRHFAWVALRTRTGRKHQIRIHMAKMGAPILGDGKYGKSNNGRGLGRGLHLHARQISLPLRQGDLTIRAPLPPHMEASWRALDFDLGGDLWEKDASWSLKEARDGKERRG